MKYNSPEDFANELNKLERTVGKTITRRCNDSDLRSDEGKLKADFELPFSSFPHHRGVRWHSEKKI